MNIDINTIANQFAPIAQRLKKYGSFLLLIAFLAIYSFLIFKISAFVQSEPSDTAVEEQLKTVQRPKIDKDTLQKIQDLQDQNIQVKALFDSARQNPFSE